MRRSLHAALVAILALVALPVLGSTASADPLRADPGACWATGDYPGKVGSTNVIFELVGEGFIPPTTKTRYWHVVDTKGFYVGGYVVYCDPNKIMTNQADLTRNSDNTGPAGLCGSTNFTDVHGGFTHNYGFVGSRPGVALFSINPFTGEITYRQYRYTYWQDHADNGFQLWFLSEAARC